MASWYSPDEIIDMSKFGFGVRDLNSESHWREVVDDFSFLEKKTILLLSGSATKLWR